MHAQSKFIIREKKCYFFSTLCIAGVCYYVHIVTQSNFLFSFFFFVYAKRRLKKNIYFQNNLYLFFFFCEKRTDKTCYQMKKVLTLTVLCLIMCILHFAGKLYLCSVVPLNIKSNSCCTLKKIFCQMNFHYVIVSSQKLFYKSFY